MSNLTTYKFETNPFLDVDKPGVIREDNPSATARIKKIRTFRSDQCKSAMALHLFCTAHGVKWLQGVVVRELKQRLREIEHAERVGMVQV